MCERINKYIDVSLLENDICTLPCALAMKQNATQCVMVREGNRRAPQNPLILRHWGLGILDL